MRRILRPGEPDPRSILVILPTWVGDFVMATPTLRAIRQRFHEAHITFLLEPNLRDLVRGGDWMNECVERPPRTYDRLEGRPRRTYRNLVRELRRHKFDWAVLLPNSFRSALIARLAGARRRIGYAREGRGFLLTDRLPAKNRRRSGGGGKRGLAGVRYCSNDQLPCRRTGSPVRHARYIPMPLVEYYADLAEAVGCERPGDRLQLFTTPDCEETVGARLGSLGIADRRPLVVISPGAKYGAAKCWPPDRFAAVSNRLVESDGAVVVVTCGPGEEGIARQIGSGIKRSGFVFDAPRLTLGEMKSLVRRSDLLICNDAGPRHLAKAFDVPVVTIFGPTHPEWTATGYKWERICRVDVDCGPCQQRVCPLGHVECMTGVTVGMVFAACKELLKAPVSQSVR